MILRARLIAFVVVAVVAAAGVWSRSAAHQTGPITDRPTGVAWRVHVTANSGTATSTMGTAQVPPVWERISRGPYFGDPTVLTTVPHSASAPFEPDPEFVFSAYHDSDDGIPLRGSPVFQVHWSSGWRPESGLNGGLTSDIAPARTLERPGPYDLEMFGIGLDGTMQHRTLLTWIWQDLGGAFHSEPTAVRYQDVSYVFAVGIDDALWFRTPDTGWASLGGVITSDLGVTTDGTSLYVAGIGADHALWTRRLTGSSWSDWETLGGALTTPPVGTYDSTTSTGYLAAVGADGAIWYQGVTEAGGWSGWYGLGGLAVSTPAIIARAGGLDVFVVGTDSAMWRQRWDGTTWSDWQSLGGGFTSNPAASTTSVLALGLDHWLYSARIT